MIDVERTNVIETYATVAYELHAYTRRCRSLCCADVRAAKGMRPEPTELEIRFAARLEAARRRRPGGTP